MKHIKYDVDSGGDAEIVLEGPLNVQGIVPVIPSNHCDYDYDRYNVQSFDNPSLEGRYAVFNVGDTETKEEVIVNVRMRVSSRHLILASSTFRAMLEGPWIENFSHSQSGPAQIMTSDWDPVAQDQSDVVVRRLGLFPRGNHDFDVKDYPQVVQRSRHDAGPPSGQELIHKFLACLHELRGNLVREARCAAMNNPDCPTMMLGKLARAEHRLGTLNRHPVAPFKGLSISGLISAVIKSSGQEMPMGYLGYPMSPFQTCSCTLMSRLTDRYHEIDQEIQAFEC
ncbi:hypothetical protein ACHAPK_009823 [Fusarium culmorum]